jgi:hypothetical protein
MVAECPRDHIVLAAAISLRENLPGIRAMKGPADGLPKVCMAEAQAVCHGMSPFVIGQ